MVDAISVSRASGSYIVVTQLFILFNTVLLPAVQCSLIINREKSNNKVKDVDS